MLFVFRGFVLPTATLDTLLRISLNVFTLPHSLFEVENSSVRRSTSRLKTAQSTPLLFHRRRAAPGFVTLTSHSNSTVIGSWSDPMSSPTFQDTLLAIEEGARKRSGELPTPVALLVHVLVPSLLQMRLLSAIHSSILFPRLSLGCAVSQNAEGPLKSPAKKQLFPVGSWLRNRTSTSPVCLCWGDIDVEESHPFPLALFHAEGTGLHIPSLLVPGLSRLLLQVLFDVRQKTSSVSAICSTVPDA